MELRPLSRCDNAKGLEIVYVVLILRPRWLRECCAGAAVGGLRLVGGELSGVQRVGEVLVWVRG